MTNYVTNTPMPPKHPAYEVHQCDIPGCWCFTTDSGDTHHGKEERIREQARAMQEARQ